MTRLRWYGVPVRTEFIDKRVRAYVGGTAVVDSRAPVLFYEDSFPVPDYAFGKFRWTA
jgi:uncharacterized protein (DUF427 family)